MRVLLACYHRSRTPGVRPITRAAIAITATALVTAGHVGLAGSAMAADAVGGGDLGRGTIVVGTGDGVQPLPQISAVSWVLADADSGEVIAARAAHSVRPPASTLKTLTALTLLPRLDPEGTYTVVDADVRVSGSRVGLLVGEKYTHDQLFTALFLPSGNDAAGALARANGGMTPTLAQMNAEARRLGALDTLAKNPSGLDAPDQRSSAYDLALIAREGMKNQAFARYASTRSAQFPGKAYSGGRRATFEIQTQNRLLRDEYPGALGIKTGFTTEAGRTFVGAAQRGGRTLIVTLMTIQEPTEDAAVKLLDWGFGNAGRVTKPVGRLVEPQAVAPVDGVRPAAADTGAPGASGLSAADQAAGDAQGPGAAALGVAALALLAGAAMIGVAALNSDTLSRRRIRRRYR